MAKRPPTGAATQEPEATKNAGLEELFRVPFMTALSERRTRRIARGTSVLSGAISHQSTNQPAPLSPLEEAILIMVMAPTGIIMHDGPLQVPGGGEELGTPFMNVVSRSAPSPDAAQATHMFMINDEGTWLIRNLSHRDAQDFLRDLPARWSDWTESDFLSAAAKLKVKVYDTRLDFPRIWPYYIGWNKQISNRPGSTVFFPVVDLTWQYINAFLIVGAEPDGQRPLIIDDYQKFKPKTFVDWIAWLGSHLRITQQIPYHPVGGMKWIRNGFVNPNNTVPLGYARTWRTDHDAFFLLQNINLLGEAMGLGSWIHASIFPPHIMYRDESKEWYGLGFRTERPKLKFGRRWPPLPASQENFVGIDGILEGHCPPYVKSMDEAVDRVLEFKYGPEGAYGDKEIFQRPYRSPEQGEEYLKNATHYTRENIEYTKEICNYIYDTYGRFPAHVNSWYVPGIWCQVSHLEIEYYDKFMDEKLYRRQKQHDELWHRH